MFERILVGFDGSVHSRRAVEVAGEIAGRFHSMLTIAVVRPNDQGEEQSRLEALVPIGRDGRTLVSMLDEIRAVARTQGATVSDPVTLHGEVLESLLKFLAEHPNLRNEMGARGRAFVERNFSRERLLRDVAQLYCELSGQNAAEPAAFESQSEEAQTFSVHNVP